MQFRHTFAAVALATPTSAVFAQDGFDPTWNAMPTDDGLNFTVPNIDNVPDVPGDVNDLQLTVLFAGDQSMVVRDLILGFRAAYRQYQRLIVETLPRDCFIRSQPWTKAQ
jgi:hypothetical protein